MILKSLILATDQNQFNVNPISGIIEYASIKLKGNIE